MICLPRWWTLAAATACSLAALTPAAGGAAAREWGDQGDGTYRNPILKADYSDPDVIRVGEDFYLVASEFHFMGMQVLHSRDLVNWRVIGQVFSRLAIDPKYDHGTAYGQGTWAPSLRFHDGKFYLYVCTPQDGVLLYRATNPAGPWELTVVKRVAGWEDPCPFWDEDGQAYLVRGQVGAGPIFLHRMSVDGTQLLDDGVEIYRGPVAEGPKVYKRRGWYYIALPEGGVAEGGQTVLRARSIAGPYERREVLPPGSPHQGGIVELASGESWFIGFKSTGHLGRLPHLVPVTWGEDDWPVFGDRGQTVTRWKKPVLPVPADAPFMPATSDEFSEGGLGAQWQWNHNPVEADWSLTERAGWLRLRGRPAAEIRVARNTLTQKLWDEAGVIDVKLSVAGLTDGQRAGVAFQSGNNLVWAGVSRKEGAVSVAWDWGGGPRLAGDEVWLRAVYRGDRGRFFYSLDGVRYVDTGLAPQLRFAQWKGARLALFTFGAGGGHVDFDYVRVRTGGSLAEFVTAEKVDLPGGGRGEAFVPVGAAARAVVVFARGAAEVARGRTLATELAARDAAVLVVTWAEIPEPVAGAGQALAVAHDWVAQRWPGVELRAVIADAAAVAAEVNAAGLETTTLAEAEGALRLGDWLTGGGPR